MRHLLIHLDLVLDLVRLQSSLPSRADVVREKLVVLCRFGQPRQRELPVHVPTQTIDTGTAIPCRSSRVIIVPIGMLSVWLSLPFL